MGKKKVIRYTEEEFVTLLENIVKRVKREERLNESQNINELLNMLDEPHRKRYNDFEEFAGCCRNVGWTPARDKKWFDRYVEKYGYFDVALDSKGSPKIACYGNTNRCFDDSDSPVNRESTVDGVPFDDITVLGVSDNKKRRVRRDDRIGLERTGRNYDDYYGVKNENRRRRR